MSLPDVNAYSAAFQHPDLCLSDLSLKRCTIRTNPLGQPRVRSGGFALTYNLFSSNANWAVRCFHRESPDRDKRYGAISRRLNAQDIKGSGYFVGFEFQPQGITMPNGGKFPIVKMAWAAGETMGSFLDNRHSDKIALQNLRNSLVRLSAFLHSRNIAHGDIQPGNIMVSDMGRKIQLIDYDGMFVDEIKGLDATEIGLPNFQHPERRTKTPWNANLDNFSFIVLDIALAILQDNPKYWEKTQSGDDKVLFSAQDYAVPEASSIFNELNKDIRYSGFISKLRSICRLSIEKTPRIEELATWKPVDVVPRAVTGSVERTKYIAAYPVVDGLDMCGIAAHDGKVVEIIGKVLEVKMLNTGPNHQNHPNSPYCFVSFEIWRPGMDQSFRLILWSEELEKLTQKGITNIHTHFNGKYISITGLVEKREKIIPAKTIPPKGRWPARTYPERMAITYSICADSATVTFISKQESDFRLGRVQRNLTVSHVTTAAAPSSGQTGNASILDRIRRI